MYTSGAPVAAAGTAVLGAEIVKSADVASESGRTLAYTGSFSLPMTALALALILVGFVLMGLAAKRNHS